MAEEMRKRSSFTRRHRSAMPEEGASLPEGGASPMEGGMGSTCGHSSCGRTCNVRYVGAVSHIRDHHAMHAARGVAHIWTASIVTGFAIVLTGVIALNSVQAETRAPRAAANPVDMGQVMQRLDRLERMVAQTRDACQGTDAVAPQEGAGDQPQGTSGGDANQQPPAQDPNGRPQGDERKPPVNVMLPLEDASSTHGDAASGTRPRVRR